MFRTQDNNYQVRSAPMEARVSAGDDRIVEGHAAVFGQVDSHRTRFTRGGFLKTIQERQPKKLIRFLWQHQKDWPLGVIQDISEDSKGLAFRARVSETDYGNNALVLLRDEAVNTASFGFRTEAWSEDPNDKDERGWPVRNIDAVTLFELGPITFASNEATTASARRSMDHILDALSMFKRGDDLEKVSHFVEALRASVEEVRGLFSDSDLITIDNTLGAVRERPAEISSGDVQQFLSDMRASATFNWAN